MTMQRRCFIGMAASASLMPLFSCPALAPLQSVPPSIRHPSPAGRGAMARLARAFMRAAFANTRRADSNIDGDLDELNWRMVQQVGSWRA
jgi:hypothetical protein